MVTGETYQEETNKFGRAMELDEEEDEVEEFEEEFEDEKRRMKMW